MLSYDSFDQNKSKQMDVELGVFALSTCCRWAGPDSVLPPDAGSAATSDQEAAATGSRCCRRRSAESRTATARTGNSAAKGKNFHSALTVVKSVSRNVHGGVSVRSELSR